MTSPRPFSIDAPLGGGVQLIEASAGTGKTYTIAALVLRLVMEENVPIDRVLVVTFTEAATAELRDRIRKRLRAALTDLRGGASDDPIVARVLDSGDDGAVARATRSVEAALAGYDEAMISTIHGFCHRMLQEHAFESGAALQAELITDQEPILREIVDDYWTIETHAAPADVARGAGDGKYKRAVLHSVARRSVEDPGMPVLPATEDLPDAATTSEAERGVILRRRLVDHARDELAARKRRRMVIGFDDLLVMLRDGLRSERGDALRDAMRKRFTAALIDEFQDTDPIQYEIFRRVFGDGGVRLFLIGDPKQAIYSFRGADIYTYLGAADVARDQTSTLMRNWRSDRPLVGAVNQLFAGRPAPFVDDRILFQPVASEHDERISFTDGRAPLEVRFATIDDLPQAATARSKAWIGKGWLNDYLPDVVATEVVNLLESGATIQGRPIEPGDIAILVRKNEQARQLQRALARRHVPTVLHGDSSVFDSDEATELLAVLRAVAEPSSTRLVRTALTSDLLGVSGDTLLRMQQDDAADEWDQWIEHLRELSDTWRRRGFIQMFRQLRQRFEVAPRILSRTGGERRMTNLVHLTEMLQRVSREERLGPTSLIRWLEQVRHDDHEYTTIEAKQIRLESDARAVQLVTIHRSKGLQYPVVFLPYVWDGNTLFLEERAFPRFHDPEDHHQRKLDVGSEQKPSHVELAESEAQAENVRLLYVALTRAEHHVVVYHAAAGDVWTSAFAWLVHRPQRGVPESIAAAEKRIKGAKPEELRSDLERLAESSGGEIAVTPFPTPTDTPYTPRQVDPPPLAARQVTRRVDPYWRMSSFTQMTHHAPAGSPQEVGRDRLDPARDDPALVTPPGQRTLLDFPKGARAGTFLHEILEFADFSRAARPALDPSVARRLAEHGFDEIWRGPVSAGLGAALDAGLDTGDDGVMRLADLDPRRRLNELGFVLPVAQAARDCVLTGAHLATAFTRHATEAVTSDYPGRLTQLGFDPLRGYLRGFIDLVFASGEGEDARYFVVDYKSNHLGPTTDHYHRDALRQSMAEHHYYLQYHLYLVALHRFLSARLPDYDPERNLGGVFYLYLRGMIAGDDSGDGVFFDRPKVALLRELDALLAGGTA